MPSLYFLNSNGVYTVVASDVEVDLSKLTNVKQFDTLDDLYKEAAAIQIFWAKIFGSEFTIKNVDGVLMVEMYSSLQPLEGTPEEFISNYEI